MKKEMDIGKWGTNKKFKQFKELKIVMDKHRNRINKEEQTRFNKTFIK